MKKGTVLFFLIILTSTIAYSEKNYIEMIKSENPEIRAKAIDGIVKANDKSAIPYLISALKDKSKIVVKKAIIALSEIGDETALDPLINISMQFYEQDLQQLATKAIRKITDRISQTGFSPVEEKESLNNKFFRVSSGYHKESLATLNDNWMPFVTGRSDYLSEEKKFSGDTIPIRLDFGYRLDSSAGIAGIGYIPKMSINTKWNDGSTGEMTLSSYFFEFNYRQYLIGGFEEDRVKKLFPYISGGLGLYFATWKVNDIKIVFQNIVTKEYSYNPEASGTQIGLNLSAGIEYFLYDKLSIDIYGGYLYARIPEMSYYDRETNKKLVALDFSGKALDVDLSGIYLLIGINLYVF